MKKKFDELDKFAIKTAKEILEKIKSKDFPIVSKKKYFENIEKQRKESDDIKDCDLSDFATQDIKNDIAKCGSFEIKIKRNRIISKVKIDIAYLNCEYSIDAETAISGSINSAEPHIIYLYVYLPKIIAKKRENVVFEELNCELLKNLRHEAQHSLQFAIMDEKQYKKSIRDSGKSNKFFDEKFEKIWEYDKFYFTNKNEMEAFLKEFAFMEKITGKSMGEQLEFLLNDHQTFVCQTNFQKYGYKELFADYVNNKIGRKDKILIKDILNSYVKIEKSFVLFYKKYGHKECYLLKEVKKEKGE